MIRALAFLAALSTAAAALAEEDLTDQYWAAFRQAVANCWNPPPDVLASEITVTVAFDLTPAARVEGDIVLIDHAPASADPEAVQRAFAAARRAILRCEGDGYGLPVAAYGSWHRVQITFNPAELRS